MQDPTLRFIAFPRQNYLILWCTIGIIKMLYALAVSRWQDKNPVCGWVCWIRGCLDLRRGKYMLPAFESIVQRTVGRAISSAYGTISHKCADLWTTFTATQFQLCLLKLKPLSSAYFLFFHVKMTWNVFTF